MKYCQRCNQNYLDDSLNFCLADGNALTNVINSSEETVVMNPPAPQLVDDFPTQLTNRRPQQHHQAPAVTTVSASKWVFPVIGILFGLLIVFGFFAFLKEEPSQKSVVSQKNVE